MRTTTGLGTPLLFNDKEAELYDDGNGAGLWMSASLHVPRDKLMAAIANVETLCEWLEEKMFDAKYPAVGCRQANNGRDAEETK